MDFHVPTFLQKNLSAISPLEQKKLIDSKVTVIGCGGLGGYVIEILTRIGIGHLQVCDGDLFEETNLNRQILCTRNTIGENKAQIAKKRIREISSCCKVDVVDMFVGVHQLKELLKDSDVVVDAVGGITFKKELLTHCQRENIPIVTGAVAGFEGFISSVANSSKLPIDFFQGENREGAENILGCPPTTVSLVATIQAQEVVSKILWNKFYLENKVLFVDLKRINFYFFDL